MRTMARSAVLLLALGAPAANGGAQEVTLPLEAFETLRQRAEAPEPREPEPPAPFALESALVDIRAGARSAVVAQELTLSLYGEEERRIPLPAGGSLTAVDLGALQGRVVAGDDGRALVARGEGRHVVRLESVVSLIEDAESARPSFSLRLTLPKAGTVVGTLTAPPEIEELEVGEGGLLRSAGEGPRWEWIGLPGRPLELRLLGERRVPRRALLPVRTEVRAATLASLSRTRLAVEAALDVRVLQGRLQTLRVAVPAALDVVSVAAGEASWERDGEVLVIRAQEPVENRLRVRVILTGAPEDTWAAPLLIPEPATRLELFAGLRVEGDGVPQVLDPGSGRIVAAGDLDVPDAFGERGALIFAIGDPSRRPVVTVEWPEAQGAEVLAAQVDHLLVDVLVGGSGQAAYQCWATLRSSGATGLTLRAPPGFELTAADRDERPVAPGTTASGLEIPLAGAEGSQTVHLAGLIPFRLPDGKGDISIPLPALSIPVGRVEVRVSLPGDREYTLEARHLERVSGSRGTRFEVPSGFSVIEASWSALSAEPGPLLIRSEPRRPKRRWF